MQDIVDFVVIGNGIAGASVAAHLAEHASVVLLEMEDQPGYHSTGRSAAVFAESYGNRTVQALTRASRDLFHSPSPSFCATALVKPRRVLLIAETGRTESLEAYLAEIADSDLYERQTIAEALELCPILRAETLSSAALVHHVSDIEVHELQQAYLRLFKTRAGQIRTRAQVLSLGRFGADWTVETKQGSVRASIVVNAAGAWAGEIGKMAGGLDIGLQPMKRTACLVEPPPGVDPAAWPMLVNAEEQFYLKPDAGLLLLSPSEETPTEPCDAQPDELDIAIGVERVEQATTLQIRRIKHKWAGLRSFVADRCPVVGYDPLQSGLFWVAALGGYGIQTAPAISRLAAALACGTPVPDDILAQGVETAVMLPARLQPAATSLVGSTH